MMRGMPINDEDDWDFWRKMDKVMLPVSAAVIVFTFLYLGWQVFLR